jgi:hypothetical protein
MPDMGMYRDAITNSALILAQLSPNNKLQTSELTQRCPAVLHLPAVLQGYARHGHGS